MVQHLLGGSNTELYSEVLSQPLSLLQNDSTPVDILTEVDARSPYQTWVPIESSVTHRTSDSDSTPLALATLQSSHLSHSTAGNAPNYTALAYNAPIIAASTSVASTTATASSSTVSSAPTTPTVQFPSSLTKGTRRRENWPREEWNTLERLVTQHTSPSNGLVSWKPVYRRFRLAFPNTNRQDRDLQMKVWRHWDKSGIKKRPNYRRSRK